jgi:prepilin-type N-terminal cleavage/methylation domain-containing protein
LYYLKESGHLMKPSLENHKGFTLVEIIAVLLIMGIISAVAVQKYFNVANSARQRAAQGAIAEIKGRLSTAQAKYIMANSGRAPNSRQLYGYAVSTNAYRNAANLNNVGTDFRVILTNATPIGINVNRVKNVNLTPNVVSNFRAAGDP